MRTGLPGSQRRRRAVLDERVLGAGVEPLAAGRRRLEAEVQANPLRAGRVRIELRRHRDVADVGAVQPVDADPGVDEPVREALGRDDRPAAVLREREALGVEAAGRVRRAVRLQQRRDGRECDVVVVQLAVGDPGAQLVEARVGLVVGDDVEALAAGVGDRRQAADGRAHEGRPGRDDRLAAELEARRALLTLLGCGGGRERGGCE